MSKCKAPGHDEAIKIWGMCRVCGKTKEGDDMENWRQEYEDAIAERNGLIQQLAEKDIYIHQLRGALGYTVPGSICENPDILNGIADALQRQLAEKTAEVNRLKAKLEAAEARLLPIRECGEKWKLPLTGTQESLTFARESWKAIKKATEGSK